MALFTLQVSNHAEAGLRVPTDAGQASWKTVYDGPIATNQDARDAIEQLSKFYRHARAFRGNNTIGKLWYAVLR